MKTLIIIIHPTLNNSLVNKRWMEELKKYPDKYTIHNLHGAYPDERIDIEREQQLLELHDRVIFQFPFYWFNCPPLFKKWLDEVLAHGWAYGIGSDYKLAGKKIALSMSVGIDEKDYHTSGRYKYTLKELTAAFEVTFKYIRADYRPLFAFYGTEHNATQERIEKSTMDYLAFIEGL